MSICSCDTMVVMGDMTDDGSIIFAKNSDRQVNEPLAIRYLPSQTYAVDCKVRTTYLEIDQVEKTYSCILFCPTNIFGAEMGFNSEGLVVGNEALFTKVPSTDEGLTGMDLVRLVLQRCSTSLQGKNEITTLLNKYGQGGNCGFTKDFFYHSSFLLADSSEAWVIETVGREYAAKRVRNGIYTLSNRISFGHRNTFDEYSTNLIDHAIEKGWCRSIEDFHFEKSYSGWSLYPREFWNGFVQTYFAASQSRQSRSFHLIDQSTKKPSKLNVTDIFSVLRDHENSSNRPTNVNLCMHGSFGPIRFNQTTGSLVAILPKSPAQMATHYATCTSLPCLSVFKPIWLEQSSQPPAFLRSTENSISNPSFTYSSENLWWKAEITNRNVSQFYRKLLPLIEDQRKSLENRFVLVAKQLSASHISHIQRNHFTVSCFDEVDQNTSEWYSRAVSLSFEMKSELSFWEEFTWQRWKKDAKIPAELLVYSQMNISIPRHFFLILIRFRHLVFPK